MGGGDARCDMERRVFKVGGGRGRATSLQGRGSSHNMKVGRKETIKGGVVP